MDPVSQAFAGATFSQSLTRLQHGQKTAFLAGALSGMAADLDVLIRSPDDSLLFLEFHRQFTHSLVFIPIGALIVATAISLLLRNRVEFRQLYIYCLLGYMTHGLLDACTSYGTQLFWPFTDHRVAWDIISIIDPLFTIPIILLVLAFALMEGVAWFTHKYVMHGFLWSVHRDHHTRENRGFFERNDLFFLLFAVPAVALIYSGATNPGLALLLWIGAGIALYGLAYLVAHDLFIHQRFRFFRRVRHPYLLALRRAHRMHHRHLGKEDGECFGMLWVTPRLVAQVTQPR